MNSGSGCQQIFGFAVHSGVEIHPGMLREGACAHGAHLQQPQPDKWTCPCGGSCSDELTRLESRLAYMESRLADFEVVLKSCRSLSLSGEFGTRGQDTTANTSDGIVSEAGVGVVGSGHCGHDCSCLHEPLPASAAPPSVDNGNIPRAAALSQGDGTAIALQLTDDGGSCGSGLSTCTELASNASKDSKASKLAEMKQPQPPMEQQHHQKQQQQQQQERQYDLCSCTESFDLVRYSTQETLLHQQQHELDIVTSSSGCMEECGRDNDAAAPLQQQLPQRLRLACHSMLTTALGRAESLVIPTSECGVSRPILEPGAPRELAGAPDSVGGAVGPSSWELLAAVRGPPLTAAATATAEVYPGISSSCETVTADSTTINMVLGSRISCCGVNCASRMSPPHVSACTIGVNVTSPGFDDTAMTTVSTGEQTTATGVSFGESGVRIRAANCSFVVSHNGSGSGSGRLVGGSRGGDASGGLLDCRLCRDLLPYAERRLGDLERGGVVARRGGRTGGAGGSTRSGKGGGDVCIQKSGFSKLDTVFVAGLVLKAAALHETEGDQAGFVRLALRKLGFECAVIIGRHFTGCICGLDSSRLLMDVGERSCLIFSFFQVTTSLSRLPDAR